MKFRPWKWAFYGWKAVPFILILAVFFILLGGIGIETGRKWWEIPLIVLKGAGIFAAGAVVLFLLAATHEWVRDWLEAKKSQEYIRKEVL